MSVVEKYGLKIVYGSIYIAINASVRAVLFVNIPLTGNPPPWNVSQDQDMTQNNWVLEPQISRSP
jgi:hypothetical protein